MYFDAVSSWYNEIAEQYKTAERNKSSDVESRRKDKEFAEITQRAATEVRFDIEQYSLEG